MFVSVPELRGTRLLFERQRDLHEARAHVLGDLGGRGTHALCVCVEEGGGRAGEEREERRGGRGEGVD